MTGTMNKERQGLEDHFVKALRRLCGVRRSVAPPIILQELKLDPLHVQCKRQTLRLWNDIAALPQDSLYRQIAADDLDAAQKHGVSNGGAGLVACPNECHFL